MTAKILSYIYCDYCPDAPNNEPATTAPVVNNLPAQERRRLKAQGWTRPHPRRDMCPDCRARGVRA